EPGYELCAPAVQLAAGKPHAGGCVAADAANPQVRAAEVVGFMLGSGLARRFTANPAPSHAVAVSALPGGTSADPASPFYLNLLRPYLSNQYYQALLASEIPHGGIASQTLLLPAG